MQNAVSPREAGPGATLPGSRALRRASLAGAKGEAALELPASQALRGFTRANQHLDCTQKQTGHRSYPRSRGRTREDCLAPTTAWAAVGTEARVSMREIPRPHPRRAGPAEGSLQWLSGPSSCRGASPGPLKQLCRRAKGFTSPCKAGHPCSSTGDSARDLAAELVHYGFISQVSLLLPPPPVRLRGSGQGGREI